ncbi:hypothetical protein TRVL_08058 [Trypanosoma vivax]|nr:hypothetical protein TRVL_08058 [Trypanosoma vivax]
MICWCGLQGHRRKTATVVDPTPVPKAKARWTGFQVSSTDKIVSSNRELWRRQAKSMREAPQATKKSHLTREGGVQNGYRTNTSVGRGMSWMNESKVYIELEIYCCAKHHLFGEMGRVCEGNASEENGLLKKGGGCTQQRRATFRLDWR